MIPTISANVEGTAIMECASPLALSVCRRTIKSARGLAHSITAILVICLLCGASAHESPVDHVERELRIWVEDNQLFVSYRVQQAERAVLMELHQMDSNADGAISAVECELFFSGRARRLASLLHLKIDGKTIAFTSASPVRRDASFGQTYIFSAPVGSLTTGRHPGSLADGNSLAYPGPFRWLGAGEGTKIRVEPAPSPDRQAAAPHPEFLILNLTVIVPE